MTTFKKKSNNIACHREDCVCYDPKAFKPINNCRALEYVGSKCAFYRRRKKQVGEK